MKLGCEQERPLITNIIHLNNCYYELNICVLLIFFAFFKKAHKQK